MRTCANSAGVSVHAVQILEGTNQAIYERLLCTAKPGSRIIVLFVWLFAFRVPELPLQVVFVLAVEFVNSRPKRPLHVGIQVHLYDSIPNRLPDLLA